MNQYDIVIVNLDPTVGSEIKKIKLSFMQLNSMVLNRLLIQT